MRMDIDDITNATGEDGTKHLDSANLPTSLQSPLSYDQISSNTSPQNNLDQNGNICLYPFMTGQ